MEELIITFDDLQVVRNFLDSISNDPDLIMTLKPDWINYEGFFEFFYESYDYDSDSIELKLSVEIRNKFPKEIFQLDVQFTGGSSSEGWNFTVKVRCNKSLFDQFNIFDVSQQQWQTIPIYLTIYKKQS